MQEGIIESSITDEQVEEFVINDGYPAAVFPISCVLSGSRSYGLHVEGSDRDYIGVHMMDTWECLEHPNFRNMPIVIRRSFNKNFEELHGTKGADISLDSFELWKFIDLLLKGSFVVYEILYMPAIHTDPGSTNLLELCRLGLTNRIGRAAKGNALHDWRRNRANRKKAVMAYYRLCQAIFFLREMDFEWRADVLFDYMKDFIKVGHDIVEVYKNPTTRQDSLDKDELIHVPLEIEHLINEVDKAIMVTRLPDQCPRKILDEILERVKRTRSSMI